MPIMETEKRRLYQREYKRARKNKNPSWGLYLSTKNNARVAGLPHTITPEDIVIPERCPILDIPLEPGGASRKNWPSVDRLDPSKGYVPDNISVISYHANRCKSDMSFADIERMFNYIKNNKLS